MSDTVECAEGAIVRVCSFSIFFQEELIVLFMVKLYNNISLHIVFAEEIKETEIV